ncbi:hypothetical protein K376_02258 [Streptomyces sp. PsTaAH-130]|nr:hypothetical protein K376_02258 [Streptomyces sp. PsTaAH-130]
MATSPSAVARNRTRAPVPDRRRASPPDRPRPCPAARLSGRGLLEDRPAARGHRTACGEVAYRGRGALLPGTERLGGDAAGRASGARRGRSPTRPALPLSARPDRSPPGPRRPAPGPGSTARASRLGAPAGRLRRASPRPTVPARRRGCPRRGRGSGWGVAARPPGAARSACRRATRCRWPAAPRRAARSAPGRAAAGRPGRAPPRRRTPEGSAARPCGAQAQAPVLRVGVRERALWVGVKPQPQHPASRRQRNAQGCALPRESAAVASMTSAVTERTARGTTVTVAPPPYRPGAPAHPCVGTAITGQRAWCSTPWLTEPSSMPAKPPRPRVPTTRPSACSAASVSTCTGWPATTSWRRSTSG